MKKHFAALAVLMMAVLAAPPALAAEGTSPPDSILSSLLTPGVIGTGLSIILGAVGLFFGGKEWLTARRKRIVATGAYHAFHIVEDWAALDESENAVDKAAKGLHVLDEWMRTNGWRPLKPGEEELAKMAFKTLHGEQKVAEKVQTAARAASLGAIGSTAALAPVVGAVP
ncbi:hypothetical protein FJV41_48295 [Myxococcus llanfairpwllgwyngyllgogerychwyrndrobwllllantysiliogogogochensis]|uniref:Lipoprotein n=1 Tax=Myxococcus llanfairpwllgwyngyllgogerychwyrndrobwllllantysiliogogogochensis TaxID=2590453 RepID=A0A540WIB0_9BACT|nr:hypothetical protein [Myxococcus llanfairpwllgwyngyllgogerychwyrndrobwllllantysiliogogogochensis]TQF08746.1 hypothetical protein FJV41_48295 [Myxococcus llanfairpwllgwyngyllgogerychwyrndrobwllllantysiliogogogochensis]